ATLDAGETAAIALAIELRAPVLMDERLGRAVARHHQVPVIGSAGVLLRAKQLGRIDAVRPILDAWRQDIGYFMSDALRAEVLQTMGDRPRFYDNLTAIFLLWSGKTVVCPRFYTLAGRRCLMQAASVRYPHLEANAARPGADINLTLRKH
ncbi:MAG: DUF3368 domain-containing protein, partial [Rhodocyclaceae bacterium]|nr:DUF3368 domain-containing protein [Rhodocyclaceae bacterium]